MDSGWKKDFLFAWNKKKGDICQTVQTLDKAGNLFYTENIPAI